MGPRNAVLAGLQPGGLTQVLSAFRVSLATPSGQLLPLSMTLEPLKLRVSKCQSAQDVSGNNRGLQAVRIQTPTSFPS